MFQTTKKKKYEKPKHQIFIPKSFPFKAEVDSTMNSWNN